MTERLVALGAGCAAMLLGGPLRAAVFDIKTVTFDGGDFLSSPIANRLFMDSDLGTALGNRAPVGTTLWFVADTLGDGVDTAPLLTRILDPGDDVLLFAGTVAGPGSSVAGRYVHPGLSVPDRVGSANARIEDVDVYVYLWNGLGAAFEPVEGSTFGILNMGSAGALPPIGNGFWSIGGDVFADQFSVQPVVVPEPTTTAVFSGALVGVFAVWRRVRRTKA
jgi:hypothetical protein